jgi:hypothetical protein
MFTQFNISTSDGAVKTMTLQYKVSIGGSVLDLYTVVVSNSEGFGIYNFTIQNSGTVA